MHIETPTLAGKTRSTLTALLEHVLRQESLLAATSRHYAWRVSGSPVLSLRRLFAEQGDQVDRWRNELGARARALGIAEWVDGWKEASADAGEGAGPSDGAADLLARHEGLAGDLRRAVGDLRDRNPEDDTTVLLSGLLDFHETSAWILRLLLEGSERARLR